MDSLKHSERFGNLRTRLLYELAEITKLRKVSVNLYLRTSGNPNNSAIIEFCCDLSTLTVGCAFKAFNVYIEYAGGPHENPVNIYDKLVISYNRESEGFQCMLNEAERQEDERNAEEDDDDDDETDGEQGFTEEELAQGDDDL